MSDSHDKRRDHLKAHLALTGVVGALLLLNWVGIFKAVYGWDTAIFLAVLGGYRIFWDSLVNLFQRRFSADLAVAIAALGALYIGQYFVAAEVIFIMLVGEALEEFAVDRTRTAIRRLLRLTPTTACIRKGTEEITVPIEKVNPGDVVIIRPGERIPVDGIVTSGRSWVDQSSLTGESMPVTREPGDQVFSGTMNQAGMLEIKTTAVGSDTKLAEVIRLVEEAEAARAPAERRADRWATYFVPIVLGAAAVTFLVTRNNVAAISVLVVACPCALVLATPTAIVAAIGRLACGGILVKGGAHLEAVGRTNWIIFDKTGTLTRGKPTIVDVLPLGAKTAQEVVAEAATAEQHSEHPLASLVVAEARKMGLTPAKLDEFHPIPGLGIEARSDGSRLLVGNARLLAKYNVHLPPDVQARLNELGEKGHTLILVVRDQTLLGVIAVEDEIRPEAAKAVAELRAMGLKGVTLLTGDSLRVAQRVAHYLGISDVRADLLPSDKVARVRDLQQSGYTVAMVGDGVNDAPSMVAANVGVALGGIGSDITADAAGVVLMTDDLNHLKDLLRVGRLALEIITENILFFALGLNVLGVLAAATSYLNPVSAAIVHQVSSLLVVCNSLRLLYGAKLRDTRVGRRVLGELERIRACAEELVFKARRSWKRILAGGFAAISALYLVSGAFLVRPGEVGVVQVFGRRVGEPLNPGLHYAPPWPFGRGHRVSLTEMRRVEVGFRTVPLMPGALPEPTAYEWNIQHRTGRYTRIPEETLVLSGDENLAEVNMVVHYQVADPVAFLFRLKDAEQMVRLVAEASLRDLAARTALDALLTQQRAEIEEAVAYRLNSRLRIYQVGLAVTGVRLQDVHPPLEVVDAYRLVSSAFEEKEKLINEAKADALKTVKLAEGNGQAQELNAQATSDKRINQAVGDAARFEMLAQAYAEAPQVTRLRLILETMETVLAPIQKIIRGADWRGRHDLIFFSANGESLKSLPAPSLTSPSVPQPREPEEE